MSIYDSAHRRGVTETQEQAANANGNIRTNLSEPEKLLKMPFLQNKEYMDWQLIHFCQQTSSHLILRKDQHLHQTTESLFFLNLLYSMKSSMS